MVLILVMGIWFGITAYRAARSWFLWALLGGALALAVPLIVGLVVIVITGGREPLIVRLVVTVTTGGREPGGATMAAMTMASIAATLAIGAAVTARIRRNLFWIRRSDGRWFENSRSRWRGRSVVISLAQFDLDGFIVKALGYLRETGDPDRPPEAEVAILDRRKNVTWPEGDGPRNIRRELLDEGRKLFFAFSEPYADGRIRCADGGEIGVPPDEDDHDEPVAGWDKAYGPVTSGAALGYVLRCDDGKLTIAPAAQVAPRRLPPLAPSVRPVYDCGVLEQPMQAFIRQFISE